MKPVSHGNKPNVIRAGLINGFQLGRHKLVVAVGDFEAVRASKFIKVQPTSTSATQQVQYQSSEDNRILHISLKNEIWFGTRGRRYQVFASRNDGQTGNPKIRELCNQFAIT